MHKTRIQTNVNPEQLTQLVAIDREAYGAEPSEAFERFAQENPHAYTLLTIGDTVHGYGLIIPVTKFGIEALARGEMDENELVRKQVRAHKDAEGFYAASVAVRNRTPAALSSRIVGYTLGQILRSEQPVVAIAVSPFGEAISHEVGMHKALYHGPIQGVNGFIPNVFRKN